MSRRSSSVPPGVNPFWSQRMRDEVELESRRPLDLPLSADTMPIPDDDDLKSLRPILDDPRHPATSQSSKQQPSGDAQERTDGSLGRGKGRPLGDVFKTPASWEKGAGEGEASRDDKSTKKPKTDEKGKKVAEKKKDGKDGQQQTSLEQALGEKMINHLYEKTAQLEKKNDEMSRELMKLRKEKAAGTDGSSKSPWSEVSVKPCQTPPPPPAVESPNTKMTHTDWQS